MTITEKLAIIQQELEAPKNLYNHFWKYNYRSAESILEALKPLMAKYKCSLTLSDDMILVWPRIYVRARAKLFDLEVDTSMGAWMIDVTSYAREDEEIKWMHQTQITGSASSYARKYALNWLFLIDDTKDSDSSNTHEIAKKNEQILSGLVTPSDNLTKAQDNFYWWKCDKCWEEKIKGPKWLYCKPCYKKYIAEKGNREKSPNI